GRLLFVKSSTSANETRSQPSPPWREHERETSRAPNCPWGALYLNSASRDKRHPPVPSTLWARRRFAQSPVGSPAQARCNRSRTSGCWETSDPTHVQYRHLGFFSIARTPPDSRLPPSGLRLTRPSGGKLVARGSISPALSEKRRRRNYAAGCGTTTCDA